MNLKSLPLKKAFSSDSDDVLSDFYIPALETCVEYDRLTGFFSSTSLAIAARGITGLIKNGGKIRLVASPKFSKEEVEVINEAIEQPDEYISKIMISELDNLENEFVRDHVIALGWLIANKKLDLRIAIVLDDYGKIMDYDEVEKKGIFHQKVGIMRDADSNIMTFSGSINETASGWLSNIEEFKVFCDWIEAEKEYVQSDIAKFNRFWNNESYSIKVYQVPKAVEEKLIQLAPQDINKVNLLKWHKKISKRVKLYDHQNKAVRAWLHNKFRYIFAMATGTGKTYAALGCIESLPIKENVLIVISCPQSHLEQQWIREISKFKLDYDDLIIADSSNPNWRKNLSNTLIDIYLGYKNRVIVVTTSKTVSSEDFIKILKIHKNNTKYFLIGDEVHGLGARESRKALIDEYDYRLGLSATFERWFDKTGTDFLFTYFGEQVFEFGLFEAINTINPSTGQSYLTPYKLFPRFINLIDAEIEDYIECTKSIIKKISLIKIDDDDSDINLDNLFFIRANIIKNAENKYIELENILDDLKDNLKWTLIYCTPQQINRVMSILSKRGIIAHRFTMDECATPEKKYNNLSERDYLLEKFLEGKYQILVAMKCLDEGVDIPQARNLILMASSGNPREYIQRIGRVIRRYLGKNVSVIYDMCIVPLDVKYSRELRNIEIKIFNKEIYRLEQIAEIAINNAEVLTMIYDIRAKLLGGGR